ncbi:hypothetical protein ACFQ1S_05525 [Kibdelosporangium lantanae]|uniref:Uncharacterized protein n=1 Tax=Kibdelosporangium lantanae TaxID=1497396 RepID=A0ABW3M4R1_9PSEU
MLADKLNVKWSDWPASVADQVTSLFSREPAPEWYCDHPQGYVGVVRVRVPAPENGEVQHEVIESDGGRSTGGVGVPASAVLTPMAHHKTKPDSVTLHASVTSSVILTFGCGAPPDAGYLNIDEGWTRSSSDDWECTARYGRGGGVS